MHTITNKRTNKQAHTQTNKQNWSVKIPEPTLERDVAELSIYSISHASKIGNHNDTATTSKKKKRNRNKHKGNFFSRNKHKEFFFNRNKHEEIFFNRNKHEEFFFNRNKHKEIFFTRNKHKEMGANIYRTYVPEPTFGRDQVGSAAVTASAYSKPLREKRSPGRPRRGVVPPRYPRSPPAPTAARAAGASIRRTPARRWWWAPAGILCCCSLC